MAGTGITCEECGTDVPSLGSLQMHRLRYHLTTPPTAPQAGPPQAGPPQAGPPPAGPRARKARSGRRAAVLGMAIAALLGGGAFAVNQSRDRGPSTAELTALAKRAMLQPTDFPGGWTAEQPDHQGNDDQEDDRALAECLGAPYQDTPKAAAAKFSTEGGMSVTSEFTIAPSLEWAKAEFATLSGVGATSCYEKVLRTVLDADKEPGDSYAVKVTRLDAASLVPRSVAPDTAGFRAAITLRRGDLTVPMTFDFVLVRHDRMEATIAFNSLGTTGFPPSLMQSLTAAVVDRLGR